MLSSDSVFYAATATATTTAAAAAAVAAALCYCWFASGKYPDGYATCSVCYTGMQPQMASKKTPPKFAIANRFIIGSFPQEIKF